MCYCYIINKHCYRPRTQVNGHSIPPIHGKASMDWIYGESGGQDDTLSSLSCSTPLNRAARYMWEEPPIKVSLSWSGEDRYGCTVQGRPMTFCPVLISANTHTDSHANTKAPLDQNRRRAAGSSNHRHHCVFCSLFRGEKVMVRPAALTSEYQVQRDNLPHRLDKDTAAPAGVLWAAGVNDVSVGESRTITGLKTEVMWEAELVLRLAWNWSCSFQLPLTLLYYLLSGYCICENGTAKAYWLQDLLSSRVLFIVF